MCHFTQDRQSISQMHLIVQCVLEKTASIQFGNPEVSIFPARVGHTCLKKAYRSEKKANANEGSNLDAQNEKLIFENDKKQQQSADDNSGARTGGMS
jgi:hypothetical protein